MTSSSKNSTKRGKVIGSTLDNINRKRGVGIKFFFGRLLEKGVPLFSGGLQTQCETML